MTQSLVNERPQNITCAELSQAITADTFAELAASIITEKRRANADGHTFDMYDDRLSALETELSFHTAKTPAGVLYQLAVAKCGLDTLAANCVEEDSHDGETCRNIERLIIQVIRHVETTSGVTRASAGLDYYGEPKHDAVAFGAPIAVPSLEARS